MNQEEDDFWKEVISLVPVLPAIELEYRIYYNEDGTVTSASMIKDDIPGRYIVTDRVKYETYYLYKVVKGQLVKINSMSEYHKRLDKSDNGYRVVKNNANLILEDNEQFNKIEYYARNN